MPDPVQIRIRIPDNLGLTPEQIAGLKQKVRVEIVASTMPPHGFTAQKPQQMVIHMVEGNNIN